MKTAACVTAVEGSNPSASALKENIMGRFYRTQLEVLNIIDDIVVLWVAGYRGIYPYDKTLIPFDITKGKILHAETNGYQFRNWESK